jgi:hypothetical protein
MRSAGSWSNVGAPDFTHGNWGITASTTSASGGESYLQGQIRNYTDFWHTYSFNVTMQISGNVFVDNSSGNPFLFPWSSQVQGILGVTLGTGGGGCSSGGGQGVLVAPNEYHFSSTCVAGSGSVTLAPRAFGPFGQYTYSPFLIDLRGSDYAQTNPGIVSNLSGGNYSIDVDFFHTMALSNFQFFVDGARVDPSSVGIETDAPVRFTSAGLVNAPEPSSALLLASAIVGLFFVRRVRPSL